MGLIAVDPIDADQHSGASLLGHGAVVRIPVVMGAAGRREDLAQQKAEPLGIELRVCIIGSDELARPSIVAHCQPERKVTLICGRFRRLVSFAFPAVTNRPPLLH